jgi:hypothetical protein
MVKCGQMRIAGQTLSLVKRAPARAAAVEWGKKCADKRGSKRQMAQCGRWSNVKKWSNVVKAIMSRGNTGRAFLHGPPVARGQIRIAGQVRPTGQLVKRGRTG